mmetsp:Transcript_2190/g.5570  ORF Transcript_2190/g.5570 Transcript_2190/m.5570 type:complete len:288 (-) Transcript_2190:489-1352(-)
MHPCAVAAVPSALRHGTCSVPAERCRLVLLGEGLEVLDLLLGADEQRHALVNRLGHHVQHARLAGGARAARLLRQERHGRALVQQAQLAVGVLGVAGVAVDASVQQRAVEVAHQRADVARAVGLAAPLLGVLQAVHVRAHVGVPQPVVALVERVDLAHLGDLDVAVRQHKLAHQRVQREAVHALADGQHHDGGGGVQAVAGALEVLAGLAHVDHALLHHLVRVVHGVDGALLRGLVDAKDGAHADAGVNVGGAVQRVKHHDVVAGVGLLHRHGQVLLLGGQHAGAAR